MNEYDINFGLKAEQLLISENYDEAVSICSEGIAEYPGYSSAYMILADCYKHKGNIDDALATLETAQNLFPHLCSIQ
ncbi:MAG: tetratricopeptide repeat protein, partial [Bacteroidota bacterium]